MKDRSCTFGEVWFIHFHFLFPRKSLHILGSRACLLSEVLVLAFVSVWIAQGTFQATEGRSALLLWASSIPCWKAVLSSLDHFGTYGKAPRRWQAPCVRRSAGPVLASAPTWASFVERLENGLNKSAPPLKRALLRALHFHRISTAPGWLFVFLSSSEN